MGKRVAVALFTVAVAAGGLAVAQPGPRGYLALGALDILAVLPPAPVTGDARDKADRAIFRATRRQVGTPRWDLATNDVRLAPADLLADFSCSTGISLTPERAPRTLALLSRAAFDANRASAAAKDSYKRRRPYLVDRGPVCQPAAELNGSYDYPSGHATLGWTWAMLLAELAPDRATAILARGRAYGESRIVCGVHNASAVEGGRVTAAAALAVVRAHPAFAADLAAAGTELDALRRDGNAPPPAAATCAAEAALIAQRID